MDKLKLWLFGMTFLCLFSATGQIGTGTLRGVITDAETGEQVPFATVVLKDSTDKVIKGVVSDFEGIYVIKSITPGVYNLEVRYVGYDNLKIEGIQIQADKVLTKKLQIKPASQLLESIEIISQAPREERAHSISIRSSESISKMPARQIAFQLSGNVVGGVINMNGSPNREQYDEINENQFLDPQINPLSTFSSDVDVASYANMRRFIMDGQLPPKDAVRIEEMINYFNYDYPNPKKRKTFGVQTELGKCDWAENHQLLRIGIHTEELDRDEVPASNIVFLLDVSGSMSSNDKLPLLQKSLRLMVNNLREKDRIAIVVYAGASGLVLPSTSGDNKQKILEALNQLRAGGSTAGAAGIELAYETAVENFVKGGINRVILATDGDFNVGISSDEELVKLIEKKREKGVFLSVLGFGTGNLQDAKMEKLADNGNGNYAYIDNLMEAKKVLVTEMGSTINTVAKDTKFQVEFNPAQVQAYRLIGYENRLLADEDFNDDTKDAGDIGSGHSVTAVYEIVPGGVELDVEINGKGSVDPLKYQAVDRIIVPGRGELATVKIRHKKPNSDKSELETHIVTTETLHPSKDFQFASAVIEFGMLLRDSDYKGKSSFNKVLELAKEGKGKDKHGYRSEFIRLVSLAEDLYSESAERIK